MCCPKVLPVGRTQLLQDWGRQVAEINPHVARGPIHFYVSTADKGKSEREKWTATLHEDHPIFLSPILHPQAQGFPLYLHTAAVPSTPGRSLKISKHKWEMEWGKGGIAQERAPGTWRRRDIKGSTQCEERGDGSNARKEMYPKGILWQLHVCVLLWSPFKGTCIFWYAPSSCWAPSLPPTQPMTVLGGSARRSARHRTPPLLWGALWAWMQLFSPRSLPSFAPFTGVRPESCSEGCPRLLLCPFPFVFHSCVPSKSLACFILSWSLLLKGPKLTKTLWEIKEVSIAGCLSVRARTPFPSAHTWSPLSHYTK